VSEEPRNAPAWVTWLLIVLGVLFVVAGIVYVTRPINQLPSFFPGHDAALHGKHTKHGLAMFGLAIVAWAAAWFTTGHKRT